MRASTHALALSLAVIACRDEPSQATPEASAPAAAPASAPAVEDTIVDAVGKDAPVVRVIEAGREPRRMLEEPAVAGERDVELTMDMGPMGGSAMPPGVVHVIVRWSAFAGADVPWRYAVQTAEMKMGGIPASGAEQAVVAAITTMYAQIAGHARRRGPAHVEIAQTRGMISQPAVPWLLHLFAFAPPAEPLGVGAKWTTESQTDADGERCTESRTYEITGIDAQEITARLVVDMRCGASPSSTEPIPTTTYAMQGELRFVPTDALAIAGDIDCTLAAKFPLIPGASDPPPVMESKLRFRLSTRE